VQLASILLVSTTINAPGAIMSKAQRLSAVLLTSWKQIKLGSKSNRSLALMELVMSRVNARDLPQILIAKLLAQVHPTL